MCAARGSTCRVLAVVVAGNCSGRIVIAACGQAGRHYRGIRWNGAPAWVQSGRLRSLVAVSGAPELPRAREAIVPTDKLVEYVLNPDHSRGRHKARVFQSALGIGQGDWRYLRDQLVAAVAGVPVRSTRITPYGVLYDVVVLVEGLNGSTHPVATVWLLADEGAPRLVSSWVDIP